MKKMLKFSLAGLIVAKITKIFLKYQNLLRRTIYFKILINQVKYLVRSMETHFVVELGFG